MRPFQWRNCFADVLAARHDITIRSFLDDVIAPAIRTLEQKITALGDDEDPGSAFEQADMEEVLRETRMAFSLSVQSLWERQLRGYLRECGAEIRAGEGFGTRVEKADWARLASIFAELRGIALEDFPSYAALDTLQHLGNACRHGDGASAAQLWMRCPDLWPDYVATEFRQSPLNSAPPPTALMNVTVERLEGFVAAVVTFWDDVGYIYKESIERKHPSLVARLEKERAERSWLPTMA